MTDRIDIGRDSADGLGRQIWSFMRIGDKLVLSLYEVQKRESTRHKLKRIRYWERLCERDSTIPAKDVPLTDEIKAEAIDKFLAELRAKLTVGLQCGASGKLQACA